ncbi:hypothetical protein [Labrys monachus]|uniref:Uncharacterized protein n=1 Tax=Labrys monachus TaxID=217067 RepID=A0ABU0FN74_9HYPH|nr:hypothetical protein [Labrys monachus]MDQ0395523.1 hypothetical protein [Labrys monachus]
MSVRLRDEGTVELAGRCPADDAEPLLRLLLSEPGAQVDWRTCDHLHMALVQLLFIFRPPLVGPPRGDFLRRHVDPLLRRAS